ncbi:MAG TPA: TIGR03862 family flavoprotein [Micropepsaceae bacterium]|nr:TIGR03862 family flavoprotein [Micropepsaceae bacterium]
MVRTAVVPRPYVRVSCLHAMNCRGRFEEFAITEEAQPGAAKFRIAVIGGGPAGLMAAEMLSGHGASVTIYERMPTMGRKLLMAGRGGLNLTHSEPFESFIARYGTASARLRPILETFPPAATIAWAEGLSQPVFVGSSGRVFPKTLKASPLLRAWLTRLRAAGVEMHTRHEWCGWDEAGALIFRNSGNRKAVRADATILALGGASWPKLGSDGAWTKILRGRDVMVNQFRSANCGFAVRWSEKFRASFVGWPIKNAAFRFGNTIIRGEAIITDYGIEGGAIYALSTALRDATAAEGPARLMIDLRPNSSAAHLAERLSNPPAKQSLANILRKSVHLSPLEINLLRETHVLDAATRAEALARAIKSVPLELTCPQPIQRAISSAGGVAFDSLDDSLMLRAVPGCFIAGEMLDWEAPTGGYLLQACFATGFAAATNALRWLGLQSKQTNVR